MTRTLYSEDDNTLYFAKVISDAHPHGRRDVAADTGLSRLDFEKALAARAEKIRQPGESKAQVFVRYAEQFEDGRALLKASLAAPPMASPARRRRISRG